MSEAKFLRWYEQFQQDQDVAKDIFGMTREEIVEYLGEPDMVGCVSRKYKTPSCYQFSDLELFFEKHKDGRLHTLYRENDNFECTLHLRPDDLDWSK